MALENNLITIITPKRDPDDHGVRTAMGTRVFLRDGTEITDIARMDLHFDFDSILSATIDIAIEQIENIEAHPFLGLETVRKAAKRYGFELVAKELPPEPDGPVASVSLDRGIVRWTRPRTSKP